MTFKNNKDQKTLDFPYIASIPYKVLSNKKICPNAKIHYGILVGLSINEGYCWASDSQLAQVHDVCIREVVRWNKILESYGYIYRKRERVPYLDENNKKKWKNARKIFVDEGFLKKCLKKDKNVTMVPSVKKDKNVASFKSKKLKKQQQEKSDVVVLSKIKKEGLEPLDIPLKEKKLIAKKYADLEDNDFTSKLTAGVEYFEKQIGLGKSASLVAIIKQAFNGNWKPIKAISTSIKEKNIAFLETISHLSEKRIGGYDVSVGKDYVSLSIASNGVEFTASDPLMIEKYETMMNKILKQAKKDEMEKQERELKLRNAII